MQEESQTTKKSRKIRRLTQLGYSETNPYMEPHIVPVKKKKVQSNLKGVSLINAETGELEATTVIHQIEEVDQEHFVKVFTSGIAAMYELTKTGHKVFMAILDEYQKAPLSKGYADCVYIAWFNNGLAGRDIGMSESNFNRGLWELIDKQFISQHKPNMFWINPALFFRGDRVAFIKEYRKKEKQNTQQLDLFAEKINQ